MSLSPNMPVLCAIGEDTNRGGAIRGPMDLAERAAREALGALPADAARDLDTVAFIRSFADSAPMFASPFGTPTNPPAALARRLGAAPRRTIHTGIGGDTPQALVNALAEEIAAGERSACLIVSGDAMGSQARAAKQGLALDWSDETGADDPPEPFGSDEPGVNAHEFAHGLALPTTIYPLFETAHAAAHGRDWAQHRAVIGDLFSRFSAVAAANPAARFDAPYTAEAISEPAPDNRLVAWPYTKRLTSNMYVDQAAALVLASAAQADAWGVPPASRVYLHGAARTAENWFVSEREDYASAPAMARAAGAALGQAGIDPDDLSVIDLYSCFPIAVMLGMEALGLPSGATPTLTGGMPYFGGPGNSYALHGIVAMVRALREGDARGNRFGLVNANGWYLTKHAFGVYGTSPPPRANPVAAIPLHEPRPHPPLNEAPEGVGVIETYTVPIERDGRRAGVLIGRAEDGARFIARTEDERTVNALVSSVCVGERVSVTPGLTNQAVLAET